MEGCGEDHVIVYLLCVFPRYPSIFSATNLGRSLRLLLSYSARGSNSTLNSLGLNGEVEVDEAYKPVERKNILDF